jgi:hypothetical protein
MIAIFEPVCVDGEHATFNAAIISAAVALSEDHQVVFFGHPSHIENISSCLPLGVEKNVNWFPVEIPDRHLRDFKRRFFRELALLRLVLKAAKHENAHMVLLTGITEPGVLAAKIYLNIFPTKRPLFIIFHSILPQFLYSAKRRFLLGRFNPKNFSFLVLGDYILREVIKIVPALKGSIRSINHPYNFEMSNVDAKIPGGQLKFGFIGIGNVAKGFPVFLRLIEEYDDLKRFESYPSFSLIGRVSNDCQMLFSEFKKTDYAKCLFFVDNEIRLPVDEYRKRIGDLDYLIMPYDEKHYKYVCSGAALDAMLLLKPIIALKTAHFSELFDQLGDIGYLCDDFDELRKTVYYLANNFHSERYALQCENLAKGKVVYGPNAVAFQIGRIYDEFVNA